jgi:hypothetical protein
MAEVTVKDYMDAVLRVRDDLPGQTAEIIRKNEQRILDLNRKLQLFDAGEDIFGHVVGVYKHDEYPSLFSDPEGYPKNAGQHYNFFDTSEFYRNFSYTFDRETLALEIYSEDKKSPLLVRKYGQLFGINQHNQITLNDEIVKPELCDFINTYL